ncbi:50S ribosomal protein L6 [Candidatus Woesebacteria bacterium RIFCSPHIGHO2_01_FULL_44_21]|uniref:50S ribosomal protein L6 n=1 Tax=Candidatus Woesebacteria bacterium RIFCSPHIGHO2_01_FULL_44_21 TaxID=1802503 RepID=A0A1F7Z1E0_9BACT|nr:MAG: 50S ribosomal protein L6 [Candidatus Woesebacteria bacterium RIFCSPHIGHO2_01_FULL_44_21]OGM71474.1 MAG: 50S ribosomal protein L6 [Candidatus Woesebacteria bacterium RIFCSPLOWO2_01_FULL_44_24b]
MGRFGKLPVKVPVEVKVTITDNGITVAGPKGTLERTFPRLVKVAESEGNIVVEQMGGSKAARAVQGATRAHIANMVSGVLTGWKKQLEVSGPGYRAELRGRDLVLMVGHSHPVVISAPEAINFVVEKNVITVEGANKDEVGHISALIRDSRRANPYTGFGVKYTDEVVRRKVGKQAGKTE